MRRLLRWTFNTLAMASLLLCLATAGLWVRSYWVCDGLRAQRLEASEYGREFWNVRYRCVFESYRGHLGGSLFSSGRPDGRETAPWEFAIEHSPYTPYVPIPNFMLTRERWLELDGNASNLWTWAVPHWSLVSAFALLPAIVAFRPLRALRCRRRRSRLGLCPACGYDLRASPGRCPECGAAPRGGTIPAAEAAR